MSVKSLSSLLSRDKLNQLVVAGDVVDNKDPKKLLRVRVRCALIHRGIKDENLPWVRPAISLGLSLIHI